MVAGGGAVVALTDTGLTGTMVTNGLPIGWLMSCAGVLSPKASSLTIVVSILCVSLPGILRR